MNCPVCGRNIEHEEAHFCEYCGATLRNDGPMGYSYNICLLYTSACRADYFVSIHRNAGVPSATGAEILLYDTSGAKYDMAKDILKRFESRGFRNRGVKIRTDLAAVSYTHLDVYKRQA